MREFDQHLSETLPMVKTPSGGLHIFYRCQDGVEGNQKLAQQVEADGTLDVRIETRGEGGQVVAPGSPPACHSSGKTYDLIQGDLLDIPTITVEQRRLMLNLAKSFDLAAFQTRHENNGDGKSNTTSSGQGDSPADDYNRRVSWSEILEPHGWTKDKQFGGDVYWKRPGKDEPGHSAVERQTKNSSTCLVVFSSNADPFTFQFQRARIRNPRRDRHCWSLVFCVGLPQYC
jgi:hypothetical protein